MKYVSLLTMVLSMLFLSTPVGATTIGVGTELILNGGGESFTGDNMPMDWAVETGSGGTYSDASSYEGSRRLTVWNQAAPAIMWQEHTYADGFAVGVTSLSFKGWARRENDPAIAKVEIVTGYNDGLSIAVQNTLTLSTDSAYPTWTPLTGTVNILHGDKATNYVKVSLVSDSPYSGYTGWSAGNFDAFSLTTIPEPSTIVLTIIGVLGLCVVRWRRRMK